MVRNKEEILEQVKTIIGDDTSDNTLNLLSDISDTIDDLTAKSEGDGEDWKKKYKENDAQWRQKYKDRFFSKVDEKDEPKEESLETDEPEMKTKFEELFE